MKKQTFIEKCYRDSDGKIVIGQRPNLPIIIWFLSFLLAQIASGSLYTLFDLISFGALFTWAYQEIFQGVNYFRRLLGIVILAIALYSRIY